MSNPRNGTPGGRGKPRRGPSQGPRPAPKPSTIGLKAVGPGEFVLVPPRCVEERSLDVEEGLELWKEGDFEAARDSLRYALQGCPDNIEAHATLGAIALRESRDAELARGHYGYAFDLIERALPPGFRGRFPGEVRENRVIHEVVEGLAKCHEMLGRSDLARELRDILIRWRGRPSGETPSEPSRE